jgi:hypothetical protein
MIIDKKKRFFILLRIVNVSAVVIASAINPRYFLCIAPISVIPSVPNNYTKYFLFFKIKIRNTDYGKFIFTTASIRSITDASWTDDIHHGISCCIFQNIIHTPTATSKENQNIIELTFFCLTYSCETNPMTFPGGDSTTTS